MVGFIELAFKIVKGCNLGPTGIEADVIGHTSGVGPGLIETGPGLIEAGPGLKGAGPGLIGAWPDLESNELKICAEGA